MAFLRTEDYVVVSESSYLVRPLYQEIARRLGASYFELKEFLPDEVTGFLKANKKIPRTELRNRLRLSCLFFYRGDRVLVTGKDAKHLRKIVLGRKNQHRPSVKEFRGTIGHKGWVRGKVRVALDPLAAAKVRKSEILVGASMSAAYVPFLRQAAGVITEFGGLTSHPVIVAREMNIPCVVGMKGIASVLKDNDKIELDASRGTIKILNS